MTKIIVLRHGESEWNHESRFAGWIDVKLSEKGKYEAEKAAKLIQDHGLHPVVMYTSKLTRSNQTGNIILERLGRLWCDHYKSWRLNERHYGAYQGRVKSEVYQELGAQDFNYMRRDYNGIPPPVEGDDPCIDERYFDTENPSPRAESLKMVCDRFMPYFENVIVKQNAAKLKDSHNKAILIVTHGSVVRALMKNIQNVSEKDISKINIPTGIPIVFEIDDNLQLIGGFDYLDKEAAEKGIEKVANEGMSKM